jgi:hypothetical protein
MEVSIIYIFNCFSIGNRLKMIKRRPRRRRLRRRRPRWRRPSHHRMKISNPLRSSPLKNRLCHLIHLLLRLRRIGNTFIIYNYDLGRKTKEAGLKFVMRLRSSRALRAPSKTSTLQEGRILLP